MFTSFTNYRDYPFCLYLLTPLLITGTNPSLIVKIFDHASLILSNCLYLFTFGNYRDYPSSIPLLRSIYQYLRANLEETLTADKLVHVLPLLQQNLSSPSAPVCLTVTMVTLVRLRPLCMHDHLIFTLTMITVALPKLLYVRYLIVSLPAPAQLSVSRSLSGRRGMREGLGVETM